MLSRTVGCRQLLLTCSATFPYGDAESHCVRFLDASQRKVSRLTVMFSRCSLERRGIRCDHARGICCDYKLWTQSCVYSITTTYDDFRVYRGAHARVCTSRGDPTHLDRIPSYRAEPSRGTDHLISLLTQVYNPITSQKPRRRISQH
jgi:hypothetical protein